MKSDPARLYVGNLNEEISQRQLEDTFSPFGPIRSVSLKCQQGMHFAFVEFEDAKDTIPAIRERNGFNLRGCILRVEMPKAAVANAPKPTVHRLIFHGLPQDVQWQELKDAVKQTAPVLFTAVRQDGSATIEVGSLKDAETVKGFFDGKNFTSKAGSRSVVRVTADSGVSVEPGNSKDRWFKFPGCRVGVIS